MALERSIKSLAQIVAAHPDDPNIVFVDKLLAQAKARESKLAVTRQIADITRALPDNTPISDVIPEYVRVRNGIVRAGTFNGMTPEEVLEGYNQWNAIYEQADHQQRGFLTTLRHLNSVSASRTGVETFGDLRNASNPTLTHIAGYQDESIEVIRTAFPPYSPPQETTS